MFSNLWFYDRIVLSHCDAPKHDAELKELRLHFMSVRRPLGCTNDPFTQKLCTDN